MAPDADPAGPITIASFDFTESVVVAELYAQALQAAGHPVERTTGLASRELLQPALQAGLVDLVPEYAGTALQFLTGDARVVSADPATTHTRLIRAFRPRRIAVLAAAPAQNQNALVVRRETADRHDLRTVSDLRRLAPGMVLGGPPECPARALCLPGYQDVYGLRFARFVATDVGGPLTVAALEGGEIDVAVLFTADRERLGDRLVYLTDDRGLQPAENITPVVRQAVLDAHGRALRERIDAVTRRLDTGGLAELVHRVDVRGEDPADVARDWLRRSGLE